jgi:Xaa-Pro aminopeptidase
VNDPARLATRRQRVKDLLATHELSALIVTSPANVTYLTGFTGSNGQVVLTTDGPDQLLTDRRYDGRVTQEDNLAVVFAPLSLHVKDLHGTVGLEAAHVSWALQRQLAKDATQKGVTLHPTDGIVEQFRQYKDPYEQAQLVEACAITIAALEELFTATKLAGMTERAIADQLSETFRRLGADGDAFAPIVASGINGAVAHHEPTDRVITVGDLVTIDCGARVNGYHADCTRTVAVGREPAGELPGVYALVKDAQQAATSALTDGVIAHDVDAAARDLIEQGGYGPSFVHGTGHGVGLEIHEAPLIGPSATARLYKTVSCTSEPGIYLPGVGGVRIEDTVIVTAHGAPQILTDLTRDLVIV